MSETKQEAAPIRAYDPSRPYIENVLSSLTSIRIYIHRLEATAEVFPETDIRTIIALLEVARRYCGHMLVEKTKAYGLPFSFIDTEVEPFPEVLKLHSREDRYRALAQLCGHALDKAAGMAENCPAVGMIDGEYQKRLLSILSAIIVQITDLKNRPL